MATHCTRPAPPAATLLQLMWLASPALPVGGFSYSEGLEAAVDSGRVAERGSARPTGCSTSCTWAWRAAICRGGRGACARGSEPTSHARAGAQRLGARRPAKPPSCGCRPSRWAARWLEWLQPRRRRCRAARPSPRCAAPSWPIAFALAAAARRRRCTTRCSPSPSAGPRTWCRPRSRRCRWARTPAQRLLARAGRRHSRRGRPRAGAARDDRQAFAPMLAILSAQHETQYSRLFRS